MNRRRRPGTVSRSEHNERVAARVAADIRMVRELVSQNLSDRAIARHLGCSKSWVFSLRERAGIPPAFLSTHAGGKGAPHSFDLEDSEEL